MALATKMSQQASKVVILNQEWFQENGRKFGINDKKMKDRLGEAVDNPEEDFTIDLILAPGLLKFGNDDAEHLDKFHVWMPAVVDIRRQDRSPPPASGETKQNKRVLVRDVQDFTLGLPEAFPKDRPGNERFPVGEEVL